MRNGRHELTSRCRLEHAGADYCVHYSSQPRPTLVGCRQAGRRSRPQPCAALSALVSCTAYDQMTSSGGGWGADTRPAGVICGEEGEGHG